MIYSRSSLIRFQSTSEAALMASTLTMSILLLALAAPRFVCSLLFDVAGGCLSSGVLLLLLFSFEANASLSTSA